MFCVKRRCSHHRTHARLIVVVIMQSLNEFKELLLCAADTTSLRDADTSREVASLRRALSNLQRQLGESEGDSVAAATAIAALEKRVDELTRAGERRP